MSLVYGLKLACDVYYYFAAIGLLGAMKSMSPWMNALPALLGLGAGIAYARGLKDGIRKFLPLAIGLPILILRRGGAEIFWSIPAFVYAILYIRGNRRATDYYYANTRFRQGLFLLPLLLFFCLTTSGGSFTSAVPSLFLHLTLSVTLMRMLRHEDATIRQTRFQMVNMAGIAGVCGIGIALSTDFMLRIFGYIAEFFGQYIFMPILRGIAWVISAVLRGITYLLSFFPDGSLEGLNTNVNMEMSGMEGEEVGNVTAEEIAANPLLRAILIVIGIAIGCIIVYFLLKLLSRQNVRGTAAEHREERESLDGVAEEAEKGGIAGWMQRRRDPILRIRHIYRKYLRMVQRERIPLNGRQDSRQIRELSEEHFRGEGLDALREVYIEARYGERASEEDARKAEEALKNL